MEIEILFISPTGDMMIYNSGGFRLPHKGDNRANLQKYAKKVYHVTTECEVSKTK